MAKVAFTLIVQLSDGSAYSQVHRCDAPDWAEIAAPSLDELAFTATTELGSEIDPREAAAKKFMGVLERPFCAWLRRVARARIATL